MSEVNCPFRGTGSREGDCRAVWKGKSCEPGAVEAQACQQAAGAQKTISVDTEDQSPRRLIYLPSYEDQWKGYHNGHYADPSGILVAGEAYDVSRIVEHAWHTNVFLVGHEDKPFNSVIFKPDRRSGKDRRGPQEAQVKLPGQLYHSALGRIMKYRRHDRRNSRGRRAGD